MNRIYLFFLIFISISIGSNAQSSSQLGFMPSLNISTKLPKDWALNFKAESRQALYQDDFKYSYVLTDLGLTAAKRIRLNTTIAGGYLMRITNEEIKHRAIQQISFARKYENFRLSHRIAMDQTFSNLDDTEFRFRYRISTEIPLQGQSLDPKEYFLKLSNEYLNSLQGKEYDLEIRSVAFIGYAITSDSKVEIGLDYRVDSFISGNTRNRFWLGLNFYHSIRNSF
ncbi:MAG: DUF2490 domain-containing protein [Bacteroidales bacterium]|nr:DUF2490 domain-containing protein [Bacteroidales bacterium]